MTAHRSVLHIRQAHCGFTLMEVLVVMALLSIIMLAMVSALRSVGQGGDRVQERLQRLDDQRVSVAFLRGVLGRVSGRPVVRSVGTGPLFEGAADHIAWVGVMPARYGVGGRFFFRLGIEPLPQGQALVLRFVPWADQPDFPDWSDAAFQTIFANAQSVVLRYEDPRQPDAAQAWRPAWRPVDELPSAVSIDLQGDGLLLEQLIVPMRILPMSDPSHGGDGTVVGGQ